MAGSLNCLPCVDAEARAAAARSLLDISRDDAKALGQTAVVACVRGSYVAASGRVVDWREEIQHARTLKRSIPPDAPLAPFATDVVSSTDVQVCNETTLQAGRRLLEQGRRPLALNLANGVTPGVGFLMATARRKRACAGPAPCTRRWRAIRCMPSIAAGRSRTPATG